MSKAARKKSGKVEKNNSEDFAGFDVQIDGMDVTSAGETPASKKKSQSSQFYLSVERSQDEEAKERGLNMEQYQLDLTPDESGTMRTQKSVMKWDARKKKYLPVMVAADGRVVKANQRKNESGAIIKEDGEKSGSYAKWAKATKKRIQKVGELEDEKQKAPLGRWARQAQEAEARAKTVEFGGEDDMNEGSLPSSSQRKPVVPFHGEIDAKHLTHKQKRMLDKRSKKDSVVRGDGKKELRTAMEILNEKRKREKNKLKQNPKMRKQRAKDAKDRRRQMHESRQMKYGARTKAKMLIFEGPKKGWTRNAKDKKNRRARNGLTGSI
jgi:ATP-dependent RNA helicase DDX54/DBP10